VQAKAAIGLDVGGTRVKAVVVEDEGTVLDQVVRQSLDNGVERWAEVAQALVQELIEQYGEELFVGVCGLGVELAFAKLGEWAGAFGAAARAMQIY
jgi:activator of 2-hydroxyglutaryl-CoA dehydratase